MKKLTIELVPKTSWFTNLRSLLTKKQWDILRKNSYKQAGYKCEICGGKGKKWPVECHEVWEYDDTNHIQKLIRLISLCPSCHQVKHIGFASLNGKLEEATKHLAEINSWDLMIANNYVDMSFELWKGRNEQLWKVDTSYLETLSS